MSAPNDDLERRLRAHFAEEADDAGLERLLAALEDDDGALDDEDAAIVADYHRTDDAWRTGDGVAPPMVGPRRGARRVAVMWLVAAAAVAALFVWIRRPAPEDPGLTAMGDGFTLHVGVVRGDVLRPVGDTPLIAGDRLGLAFSGPAGHLRVLASSADGVAPLHPLAGVSTAVEGGDRVPLDAGAVLTPGDGCEWIVGLFSEAPIALDVATAAVEAAGTARDADGRCALGPITLPGVKVEAVEIPR